MSLYIYTRTHIYTYPCQCHLWLCFFFSILSIVYINIVYINMGTKYTILRYTYTYYIPKESTSACLLFFDPSMSGIRGRQGQDEGVQGLRRGPEGARWCGGAPRAIGLWFCEAKIGGFLSHGGTQIAGFFLKENPNLKWMRTGGTPHFRKPPYNFYNQFCIPYNPVWIFRYFNRIQLGVAMKWGP